MSLMTSSEVEAPGYSFYIDAGKGDLIQQSARIADFVIIRGRTGPGVVESLRHSGWHGDVLFDRGSYEKSGQEAPAQTWFEQQQRAGARHLLSPGRWIDSSTQKGAFLGEVEREVQRIDAAGGFDATLLFAIHHHWLTKYADIAASVLADLNRPIALVLSHSADPLSVGGAVDGLIHITRRTRRLTLMRIDHGGIGGVAFGAAHASFGLRTGTRHVVPPGKTAHGKRNDRSARLFVRGKLDWFTAMTIAGWATVEVPENCDLACCEGEPLSRFLDARIASRVNYHNMVALADVASYIVNANPHERRRLFAELCQRAIGEYDRLGFMGIEPKPQLQAWALWA